MSQVGHIHASALSYATGLVGATQPVIALVNHWADTKGEVYVENLSYPQMRGEIQNLIANEVAVAASYRREDVARRAAQRDAREARVVNLEGSSSQQEKSLMSGIAGSGGRPPVDNKPPQAPPPVENGPQPGSPFTNQPPQVPGDPVSNQPPTAPPSTIGKL